MQATDQPTVLIIIGITGDLSRRYLLPAIEKIAEAHALPEKFKILGITRQDTTPAQVLEGVQGGVTYLQGSLRMCQVDLSRQNEYGKITEVIEQIEQEFGAPAQRLFYLSIPPQASQPVVRLLGQSGLSKQPQTKLLLEKPFGSDLISAEALLGETEQYFREDQIYRIDHYLAKEVAQSIIVFRQANPLFAHTWNKDFIERIEVVALESIDIEGRNGFYEQTGALRDVIQSHVLQLAALTLMDVSDGAADSDIPKRRLEALRHLHIPVDQPVSSFAKRGQYKGYAAEVQNPGSMVETYAEVSVVSSDDRWQGVPIILKTGKAFAKKYTAIKITYRSEPGVEPNRLILQIQPDANVSLTMWTKEPGYVRKPAQQTLRFAYGDYFDQLPEAYEQVLLDAVHSNHALFTSSDEVRESWRILEPVQKYWEFHDDDLVLYEKGTEQVV